MYSAPALPKVRSVIDPATLRDVRDPRLQALDTVNQGQNNALSQAIQLRQAKQAKSQQVALQDQYNRIKIAASQAAAAAKKAQDAYSQQQQSYNGQISGMLDGLSGGYSNGAAAYQPPGAESGITYKAGDVAGGDTSIWGDPRSSGWQSKNLVTFKQGKFNVTVNRAAASAFQGFLHALTSRGYKLNDVEGYELRNKRTNNTLSEHAFGTAIDINPDANPAGYHGEFKSNMPTWVGALAARYGLVWGGYWGKTPDPMHFEYVAPWHRGSESGIYNAKPPPAPTASTPSSAPTQGAINKATGRASNY